MSLDARAQMVIVSENELVVLLTDGRRVAAPLAYFPRLFHAARDERSHYELLADGIAIRWPDIDEDVSVAGLLRTSRAEPIV